MRRAAFVALALLLIAATPAAADDDRSRFRRTTPRAVLQDDGGTLLLGVPAGRAWGIESELRPLADGRAVAVRLAVDDGDVREAFVRVAYYARPSGRSRQIAVTDSDAVRPGDARLLVIALDPPPGAVAYRVRVLARLLPGLARSREDAVRARVTIVDGPATRSGSLFSRLLPDGP